MSTKCLKQHQHLGALDGLGKKLIYCEMLAITLHHLYNVNTLVNFLLSILNTLFSV